MDWRDYEEAISLLCEQAEGIGNCERDAQVRDRHTGELRQVDLLTTLEERGHSLTGFGRRKASNRCGRQEGSAKFVANVASGVHSRSADEEEKIFTRLRTAAHIQKNAGQLTLTYAAYGDVFGTERFAYEPDRVAIVLIELMAGASLLLLAPCVGAIEAAIKAELKATNVRVT